MAVRDNLLYMLNVNKGALHKLLDDVSEEESMERGKDNTPHIRWQTGHLAHTCGWGAGLLSGEHDFLQSDQYKELFGGGSEVSDDPAAYPPFSQLRDELYEAIDKSIAAAGEMTDEQLEADVPEGQGPKSSIINVAQFLCMHAFYHAGQITQLRRVMGRERPFG